MTSQRHQKQKALEALLVLDAKSGNPEAMQKLVDLRGPRLLSHAARLSGDREAAFDIVQESWIQIIQSLPSLKNENAFLAWALCIVSRQTAAHIKSRQRDRKHLTDTDGTTELAADLQEDWHLDTGTVRLMLKKLPPVQQATIALFYLEDMSVSEVAKATDVPVGTVKTRLMKARKTLRALLEGEKNGQARQDDRRRHENRGQGTVGRHS